MFKIFILFALIFLNFLQAAEPIDKVAVNFLIAIRDGKLAADVGGDTAIRSETSVSKKALISKIQQALKWELQGGDLMVVDSKKEGDFAAVIVQQMGGLEMKNLQVYPVALVQSKGHWKPAPILGSFENAVLAYTQKNITTLKTLERWMMQRRVESLQDLQLNSEKAVRAKIFAALGELDLKNADLNFLATEFIQAIRENNQSKLAAFFGALSDPFPKDWNKIVNVIQSFQSAEGEIAEDLIVLRSKSVLTKALPSKKLNQRGIVTIGMMLQTTGENFDVSEPVFGTLELQFQRSKSGYWMLNYQDFMLEDDKEMISKKSLKGELAEQFAAELFATSKKLPMKEWQELFSYLLPVIESGDMQKALAVIKVPETKKNKLAMLQGLVRVFNRAGIDRRSFYLSLASHESNDAAVIALRNIEFGNPERGKLGALFFEKREGIWYWVAHAEKKANTFPEKGEFDHTAWASLKMSDEEAEGFKKWMPVALPNAQQSFEMFLNQSISQIENIDLVAVPTKKEVTAFAEQWIHNVKTKDLRALAEKSAFFSGRAGTRSGAYRALTKPLFQRTEIKRSVLKILRTEDWAIAAILQQYKNRKNYLFMPVVLVEQELKCIPQLTLLMGGAQADEFFNRMALARARKLFGKEKFLAFKKLFQDFQQLNEG